MRVPVAVTLESRDGTVSKDAKVVNGIVESAGDQSSVRKRSGCSQGELIATGTPQALVYWNGLKAIIGDTFCVQTSAITTLNPLDKGSNITLSNGNLTATASGLGSVRSRLFSPVGWYGTTSGGISYFEVTIGDSSGGQQIGVGNSSVSLASTPALSNNAVAYYVGGGIYKNGVQLSAVATATTGDVIGVFYNANASTVAFTKNGTLLYTASGVNVPASPLYAIVGFAAAGTMTVNFGASSFSNTPPSGAQTALTVSVANDFMSWVVGGASSTPFLWFHNSGGTFKYSETGGASGPIATFSLPLVYGAAYMDGYIFYMDKNAAIYNTDFNSDRSTSGSQVISAQGFFGGGVAIAKSQNYIVAWKDWSTEYFYDAGNPTGSPLAPVDNGLTQVGCAHGASVQELDGSHYWLSQVLERGRSVHVLQGLQQKKVSTPAVERILNQDDLQTIYSYGLKMNGHALYLLTLKDSNITLVYDATSDVWDQWTSLTIGNSVSVSSITLNGTTATVTTGSAHGLSDGDPVKISGANQSAYNGIFQAQVVSSTVFTVTVSGSPASPATGTITMFPYTESYFKFPFYANANGVGMFLHETDGHRYIISSSLYQDAGVPINFLMRTARLDGGDSSIKVMSRVTVIGDSISDIAMLRCSDDDYQTNKAYRPVDLSLQRPSARRWGDFRRRSLELRHVGNTNPRFEALELEIPQ